MPPRRKPAPPAKPTLTLGAGALVVGLLYLFVHLWRTYPREACAVGEALCREHLPVAPAPVVLFTAPIPPEPFSDQVRARDGACPDGYRAIRGGCWFEGTRRPPCPFNSYEYEGKCWLALIVAKPLRSVEEPRKPGVLPWR